MLIVVTTVIAAIECLIARAEQTPAAGSLAVTLEIDKPTAALGEPVYATVHLKNGGASSIDVPRILDPQLGHVRIIISSADRPRFVYLPLFVTDAVRATATLGPGEETSATFPIFYGGLGWTFRKPDTYRISATIGTSKPTAARALSQPVNLRITEDDGASAILFRESRAGEQAAKFLLWQRGDHLRDGLALLADILKIHPDSHMADFVRAALGHNFSRDFRDYVVGRMRPADCETALEHLRHVRDGRLPSYLQVQKHLDEARCLSRQSRTEEAGAAVKAANDTAGGRPEYRILFQQAIRLQPSLSSLP
ncbi:hypothetical protein YTPLAS18_39390 [Nitrospira sp.]|nr:hypothetical protein YTPLAS18_39390 [Nitrospira sp.]